jgi:lysine decarboxylase
MSQNQKPSQSQAPVLDALGAHLRRHEVAFTPPGHKQGRGTDPRVTEVLGDSVFHADIVATELEPPQSLQEAEKLMAEAVNADHAFFSTCGSSLSVKAAMLAVAKPGDELLIGRDVHKSVVSGLVLGGIRPVWVEPSWDPELHLAHPPSPEAYRRALEEHPNACGAFVTSPTPYGTVGDVRTIADLCHAHGVPLVVDEAWGAHLPFHPDLPKWAMDAGADVCVTSVHKMGAGLEQSSVYHQQGKLVEATALRERADLFDTTSPSVLIYAALDGWRRQMVEFGHELLSDALILAADLRADIERIAGLHVHGRDDFCGPGRAFDLDPLQVIVDLSPLGCSGYQAAEWLHDNHAVDCHLADHRRVGIQLSFADGHETTSVVIGALADLARSAAQLPPKPQVDIPEPHELRLKQEMIPREAYFAEVEDVPAQAAAGRISAEMITPYPPGIPAVLPGERLDQAVVDYLTTGLAAGMGIPDAANHELKTFRVVAE